MSGSFHGAFSLGRRQSGKIEKKIPEKCVAVEKVQIGGTVGPSFSWVYFLGTSFGIGCSFSRGRFLEGVILVRLPAVCSF